jgi:hypothetical protein
VRNDPKTYTDDGTDVTAADQTRWMLPEEAPGPQSFDEKPRKKGDTRTPASTHTGTDPLGRAIGPAEDHREIKEVIDPKTGRKVKPKADKKAAERPDSPIAALPFT